MVRWLLTACHFSPVH